MAAQTDTVQLVENVHWIGALDPELRTFDVILKTANGTTYNSYLVEGAEGVAIIDTVKEEFQDVFFAKIESLASYEEIKAIVLNHLEPDHAGAVPELLRRAPHAKVYVSVQGLKVLRAILKDDFDNYTAIVVDTHDTVSLGNYTLRFLNTPYVHWPDTQCTFLEEKNILFSCDLFGCHFCDDRLFNDLVGDFRFSFEYYFDTVMRPFKSYVDRALNLVETLNITTIAPGHGPILRVHPGDYVHRYRQMTSPDLHRAVSGGEKSLLIFYISAYGATEDMAKAIFEGASKVKRARVSLFDLEGGEIQPFVNLIEEADGIVIGSPTINGDAVRLVWEMLSSLVSVDLRGKLGAAFGSYGWSGEAVGMIEDRMRGLKLRVPEGGLRFKLHPNEKELKECRGFGKRLAKHLTGQVKKQQVVDFAALQ